MDENQEEIIQFYGKGAVIYHVTIVHCLNGDIRATFKDIGDSDEDREKIAWALRKVADDLEDPDFVTVPFN